MVGERASAAARPPAHRVDRGGLVAARGEQPGGDREQLSPGRLPTGDVLVRPIHRSSCSPHTLTDRLSVCSYRPTVSPPRLPPAIRKKSTMYLEEFDAHRRVVRTRSGEISYIDIGTGPVALFVHGIATNAYLWRNVIGALTRPGATDPGGAPQPGVPTQRRCLPLHLPRHAQTPVPARQALPLAPLAPAMQVA